MSVLYNNPNGDDTLYEIVKAMMYTYIVLGIFFGLFTFSMMFTMLKHIREDSSTIDNKAKKKEPKGA